VGTHIILPIRFTLKMRKPVDIWINYCKLNYDRLKYSLSAIDNEDIGLYRLREALAEIGTELTPKELMELSELIRETIQYIDKENENEKNG
jgi:hypothetical protein